MNSEKGIAKIANDEFLKHIKNLGDNKRHFRVHIEEMIKWADYMIERYPGADREILETAIYFHDIGYCFQENAEQDHAVLSEKYAKEILNREHYSFEKGKEILHCVRAHRNRDVKPSTLEAKMLATIDSASHVTIGVYFDLFRKYSDPDHVLGKIDRDYRDLAFFPEIQKEMKEACDSWKKLIEACDKIGFNQK